MSFGFGQTQPQQQQQNTFGGGFGGFGANQQQQQQGQQPSTGLFGQPQQQQPQQQGGGLFGSTTTTQQQQPSGGLFGQQQQQQQPATGGGLFGNTQPATGGGGLFGNTQQQPATGGGLFGNTQQQQQQQPATGGLFGNTQQQQQPTNAFGGGSSLFGNTQQNQNQNQQPATGGGGLSGNTTQNSGGGGGLFGNTQPQQQQQQSGGLFGNTQQQPASGGLFGNTQQPQPQQSLFGQQQLTSGGLFGNQQQQQQSSGLFGSKPLGQTTQQQPSQQQQGGSSVLERVQEIYNAWDTSSPSCRFQHFFYNVVDRQQVGLYGRPANATNEALWQKAVRENPDPSCLVPVLGLGFEDLKKRVDAQGANAAQQQQQLTELRARLEAIAQKHTLSTSLRAQKASMVQTELKQRLTALVRHLHLLIPSVRSSSIRPEEEALRAALENIDDELKRPGGLGRMKGKLSDLWTAVGALAAVKQRAGAEGSVEWAVVDDEGLNELAQILLHEQQGLIHLTKILKDSMADVEVIEVGIGAAPKHGAISPRQSQLGRSQAVDMTVSMLGR